MSVRKGSEKSKKGSKEVRERNLSDLQSPHKIVAFVISDLHLRPDAPAARAEKGDRWYPVLKGYLKQVSDAMNQMSYSQACLCAGDIFHSGWKAAGSPPELINFALSNLPRKVYAIPGQHDLPHHRLEDIKKSAYWTLEKANKIHNLAGNFRHLTLAPFLVSGYGWGEDLVKMGKNDNYRYNLALIHRYVWKEGHVHPGAADKDNVHCVQSDLEKLGYDIGIAGDNHSGFLDKNFLVPGAFYRARSDELDYKPAIAAIYEDGTIIRYFLDVSNDEFVDDQELAVLLSSPGTDTSELVEALSNYKEVTSDFFDMVEFYAKKMRASESVKQIITSIKDKAHGDKK